MSRTNKEAHRASATRGLSRPPLVDEGLFQMAFHNSPAMQSVVRASDGVLVEVNDTFLQKFGRSRDEVIGKTADELDFWLEPEKLIDYRREFESNGYVRGREVRLRAKNGEIFTVLLSSHPVKIGGVLHYLSAGVDITARKAAEAELSISNERLRQSEERFSKVFRTSPALVIITRLSDATFVAANEAFLRTTGFSEAEVIGKKAVELNLHPSLQQREEFLQELHKRGSIRDREFVLRAKDGQLRTLLVSADMIEMDGQLHVQTVGLDITARKVAEAKLRESEEKFRALFEGSSQGVMIQDEEKFLDVNSATLRMLGFESPADILGKHPKDSSPPFQPNGESSESEARRHIADCMKNGSARFDWVGLTARGEEIHLEVILTRVALGGRNLIQAVVNDISRRKHAEAELQNALAKERELSQLKSDFVSLVSHEFRTPLEIIMSSTDNLQRYHERLVPEKREQLLNTINKSVRRMAGMMEDVLLLGRVESGKTEFKPAKFDLGACCRRISDEIQTATGQRCPVKVRINDSAKDAFGDENLLRHILSNLLSNAVKYSTEGGTVSLEVQKKGKQAILHVVDYGCGIPQADQPRVFQAFHRGNNVRHIHGTGLGLIIVRRCVELHNGEIDFKSVEGKGTTFTVTLPLFTKS